MPSLQQDKDGRLSGSAYAALAGWGAALIRKLNGGLRLGNDFLTGAYAGNFDGQLVQFITPAVPGDAIEVFHGLGRVPLGRIVLGQDAYGRVADTNLTGWGPEKVYFQSDVAGMTVKLLII